MKGIAPKRDPNILDGAGPIDLDDDGFTRANRGGTEQICKSRRWPARQRDDFIAGLDTGFGRGRVGFNRADDVRGWRPNQGEEESENENGQQKVGGWTGKDDEETLPDGTGLENTVAQMLGNVLEVSRIAGRRHVPKEAHITAKRQPSDFPPGSLLVSPAEHFTPEADRESLGGNPEPARNQIVAEFVEEHDRPQSADECDEDKPEWSLRKRQ